MELYPYSKQYEVNLLLKNRFFGIDNELKNINIHLPSNLSSKRHVNSKLNLLSNHFFGLSYNFLHDEELFNDENIKNISKANHAVIFNLNKSPINWETSITNSKIYQSNNIEYSTISKSSLNFNTKISLLNIIFENTRKNNAFESREYGVSFELRPFKSFFIKTDYNKYLYKEENNSDSLRLDWRLNAPFINSYCSLNLKTISDNILDKNKEISGIMKFNLIPSQTISLDFAYIPQITKNQNNKILKDYSSNQINFLLSNSNDFLLELKSQKNNYFSDLNTNSVLTNYTNNSYFLRSNIKFNNLLSLDNHFSCDIKKYNFNTNKNYGFVLNTCMQFNKNKFLNCGYEYQNDNLSLKNGFTMSFSYNNSKTFKFLTLLKFFSSKDFINPDKRSSSVEPSFETTINPKSNLELNFHYNYSKEISNSSSSKNSIDASINYHINKHFEFKLNASYYKNTNPHIKNINIESIFTTTFQ